MSAPRVRVQEQDLSTRVPSTPGVYGAIVVKAKRGPVNVPVLVTNDTQYLAQFTPAGKVEVGEDLAHFSALAFLEKSDKMWVVRAAKDAKFGGAAIKRSDATTNNQALGALAGLVDPLAYVFDSAVDTAAVAEVTKFTAIADVNSSLAGDYLTFNKPSGAFYLWFRVAVPAVAEVLDLTCVADVASSLNNKYFFLNEPAGGNGHYVWFNVAGAGVDPGPFGARVGVQVNLNVNDSASAVATAVHAALPAAYSKSVAGAVVTITNAVAGAVVDATAENSGFTVNVTTQGADAYQAGVDPAPGGTGVMVQINQNDAASAVATAAIAALAAHGGSAVAGQPNQFRITNAAVGAVADAAAGTSGFTVLVETQGVDEVNNTDECMLIYQADPGVWGKGFGVKITNYLTNPDKVKEPGAFMIEVFALGNNNLAIESFICSRVPGAKDGFGRNIYVEEVLAGSQYIRAFDNVAVPSNITPKDQASVLFMNGGDDGLAVTDAEMIAAANKLANPDEIQVSVLMDGGNATPAYGAQLEAIAASRGDAVALLSTPISDEASATYITDIIDYRKTELNLNSSYAALFTPHALVFDRFNDRRIYVSPEGYVGAAISYSNANFEIWYPPAGFRRGVVRVLDLRRRFTKGEMDALYDAGVNPLRFAPGKGIAIWGQKTLLARPSALDRLNVRLLLNAIKPPLTSFLEDFVFELNDEATRSLVSTGIEAFMRDIQARRGVTDFAVICDETNNTPQVIDNNQLIVDLYVKPTRSAEDIALRLVITSSGVSFDQAASLV